MSDYIFYPGCSMESSAKAYYASVTAVCKQLGIGLGLRPYKSWNDFRPGVPPADCPWRSACGWVWIGAERTALEVLQDGDTVL